MLRQAASAVAATVVSLLGGCDGPADVATTPSTPDAGDIGDSSFDGSDARVSPDAEGDSPPDAPSEAGDPWAGLPTRYPADAVLSPVSPFVAENLRLIAARAPSTHERVFMKAGASGTVSKNLLYCFAGLPGDFYSVDLQGHAELQDTIEWFRDGDADGTTPFDRPTLCAEVGRTAAWAISGSPSPLDQEIEAIGPRFAVVNYGTNDMEMGVTYASALSPFYRNLTALVDQLLDAGIVPLVSGLGPRADSTSAARWVPTYNAVTRGIAEARQVPYLNMFRAYVGLPGMGLSSDGLHGNVYTRDGEASPCVFDELGLEFAYNTRNLATLMALHAMRTVVNDSGASPDASVAPVAGAGITSDPFLIDTLPFTHHANTTGAQSKFDAYPGCGDGQDESGPELVYRLQLASETAVRLVVLDGEGVDVDIHLLGDPPEPDSCLERADRMIERTLPAGTHHVIVDTFSTGGAPASGEFLLVVVACEPGDPDCS